MDITTLGNEDETTSTSRRSDLGQVCLICPNLSLGTKVAGIASYFKIFVRALSLLIGHIYKALDWYKFHNICAG